MTTQSDHDARTPEERLLSKKRLGSFYLDDVRAIINRAEAAEAALATTRQALTEIEAETQKKGAASGHIGWIARRALADTDQT